jgi:outer membrane receptor for ferrienterochelin and colicins
MSTTNPLRRPCCIQLLLAVVFLLFSTLVLAQEKSATNIADMTLEELVNVKVYVSSKKDEKVSESPGFSTVYSDLEIEKFGYYNLSDLANITAGYSSYSIYGEKVFETRGQKAGSFNNNKHLLLVGGIPVNHARSYKASIENELPLLFASRVEFLKGPASALYGTSAFFGVVSVVPKTLVKPGSLVESKFSAGNVDGEKRVMVNSLTATDEVASRISLGFYEKEASEASVGKTNSPLNRYWDDQRSIFMNIDYQIKTGELRGLSPGFLFMKKDGGLGESYNENGESHQLNDTVWETTVPYVKFLRSLSDKVEIYSYAKMNYGKEKGNSIYSASFPSNGVLAVSYESIVTDYEALGELRFKLSDRARLIAGLNFDTRKQEDESDGSYFYTTTTAPSGPYEFNDRFAEGTSHFDTYSAYTQYQQEFSVLKGLILTAGLREDFSRSSMLDQNNSQLSPRLNIVQKLDDKFNLKASYGTALRAPGIKEVQQNDEVMDRLNSSGQSSSIVSGQLKAETMSTFELGMTYNDSHYSASIVGFHNETRNSLDGVTRTVGGTSYNFFENSSGAIKANGMEFEIKYANSEKITAFANYAIAAAESSNGNPIEDVPSQKINLGASHFHKGSFQLNSTMVTRWVENYRTSDYSTKPPGSVVVDLNFLWMLTKRLNLEYQIRNLFNQKYQLPKHNVVDVPMPERAMLATLSYRF